MSFATECPCGEPLTYHHEPDAWTATPVCCICGEPWTCQGYFDAIMPDEVANVVAVSPSAYALSRADADMLDTIAAGITTWNVDQGAATFTATVPTATLAALVARVDL